MNLKLKRNWIFRIQLLSLVQDAGVLNLLHFPTTPLLPTNVQIDASYWSRGCVVSNYPKNVETFINLLSNKQINSINLSYNFLPYYIPESNILIKKVTNQLDISPTNSLWVSTSREQSSSYTSEAIRMTFESRERSLRYENIFLYPTLLDSIVELQGLADRDEMHQIMLDLLLSNNQQAASLLHPGLSISEIEDKVGLLPFHLPQHNELTEQLNNMLNESAYVKASKTDLEKLPITGFNNEYFW